MRNIPQDRRPGDGGRNRRGVNFRAAQSLRDLQKHRPLLQSQVARPGLETKECFCADASQGVVLKKQLRARLLSSLEAEIIFDDFAYHGGMIALCRVDYADPINNLWTFAEVSGQRPIVEGKNAAGSDDTREKVFLCIGLCNLTIITIFISNRSTK